MAESDILVHLITENAPRRLSRTSSVSIELLPDGKCHVTTRVWGRADASYALVPDVLCPPWLPTVGRRQAARHSSNAAAPPSTTNSLNPP